MTSPNPTNTERAQWAKNALAVFTAETYSGDHPDTMHPSDLETALCDLICDLLHLANQAGMDMRGVNKRALAHFNAEITEEE